MDANLLAGAATPLAQVVRIGPHGAAAEQVRDLLGRCAPSPWLLSRHVAAVLREGGSVSHRYAP